MSYNIYLGNNIVDNIYLGNTEITEADLLGSKLNQNGQIITDAMLTEEGDFYMASEDEENIYLQLIEEE